VSSFDRPLFGCGHDVSFVKSDVYDAVKSAGRNVAVGCHRLVERHPVV